jgi:isopentenyl-diphosphate delta-isomerase
VQRKKDHIAICLDKEVGGDYHYWQDIKLVHHALPDFDFDQVDTSCQLFGRQLAAPLVVAAITGGHDQAENINRNLAQAAARRGLAMGVGSQRPALEDSRYRPGYEVIRQFDIPLVLGNLGAPQLILQNGRPAFGLEQCRQALDMIGGHVLAVHLNYTQEMVQAEGDHKARGVWRALGEIARHLPILAKETGAGISREMALALKEHGVIGLDVGGQGGTSFPAVEHHRARAADQPLLARLGRTFWDWGIPTPVSLLQCRVGLPLIATGGLRSGLDVAKALALGASAGGLARGLLRAAIQSAEAVEFELEALILELKTAMFLCGARNLAELSRKPFVLTGRCVHWLQPRVNGEDGETDSRGSAIVGRFRQTCLVG